MSLIESLFSLPSEMDQMDRPVLCRFGACWGADRGICRQETLRARTQLCRAGVEYLAEEDQYRCPEGEHLKLLKRDNENRLAIYQIRISCQFCRLKESCAPHSDARQVTPAFTRHMGRGRGGKIPPAHQRDYAPRRRAHLRSLPAAVGWQARNGPLVIAQVVSVDFLIHKIRAVFESHVPAVRMSGLT